MSYKLPDGTEIDCTLVQARRVWEICVTRDCSRVMPSSVGVEVGVPGYPDEPYLVLSDGRVFNLDLHFQAPPPPMESEKPPEVSEFHRGVITAIEAVWTSKFSTAPWTWEVQDVLARSSPGELRGLLEIIARADAVSADAVEALERLKPPQQAKTKGDTDTYDEGYCRGKINAIKVVWNDRFGAAVIPRKDLNILTETWHRHADSVDDFLRHLAIAQWTREGLIGEIERFEKLNDSWRKRGGK